MKEIIAFVHAKGNSMRLPGKNMRKLGGLPLFCHATFNAHKTISIKKAVIDSDSDEILKIGERCGAVPLKRPSHLANNDTDGNALAYWAAINYPDSKIIVQISPTAPFLHPSSIDDAISLLLEKGVDSVAGVFKDVFYEWVNGKPAYFVNGKIPNSFNKNYVIYETMGLCVVRTEFVLTHHKRLNANSCLPYFLSRLESIDINTIEDFRFAEIVWRGMRG